MLRLSKIDDSQITLIKPLSSLFFMNRGTRSDSVGKRSGIYSDGKRGHFNHRQNISL